MKKLSSTISLLALAIASPALADTSAAELWAEWQAQAEATGQTMSAEVSETGTGLTLTNVTTILADENVSTNGVIDQIDLIENPDGTVSVALSELYTLTFTFEIDEGDPPANIELLVRHENLDIQISGDAGARVYTYAADQITLHEGRLWGGDGEPPEVNLEMIISDLASTYNITGTDPETMRFTTTATVGGMSLEMDIAPANASGRFKTGLHIGAMTSSSEGTLLSLTSMNQFDSTLPEGFDLSGTTTYGPLNFEMMFEERSEAFSATYSNDGGSVGVSISPSAMAYDVAASGASAHFEGTELPVPVELSVGSSELALSFPLAAGDTPQDMELRLGVQDFVVGESLLSMVDPASALPRDPMSLLLDTTGQVQLFMDLVNINPEEMSGPPGELRAVTVNELSLSVGGAALTGSGDFSFAPNQMIPMPVGAAELELSGGNALLDALIAGGLVPNEQGAFIRGAANVFARPGAAPDTLETTVEFGADGSITANGIPLQ